MQQQQQQQHVYTYREVQVDWKTSKCESTILSLLLLRVPVAMGTNHSTDNSVLFQPLAFQFQSLDVADAAAAIAVVNGMCNYSPTEMVAF